MSIGIAFKLFFKALGDRDFAAEMKDKLASGAPKVLPEQAEPKGPRRTEAVELLATLQREGRLVDFLQEKIEGYSDAQIGAAVRDIHRDCGKTLSRLFAIAPLENQPEGASINLPAEIDPGAIKLTGQVGSSAKQGKLCHHGWKITRHDLPAWTGRDESAWVIAPAEVEVK
jgi:hypothetical protein